MCLIKNYPMQKNKPHKTAWDGRTERLKGQKVPTEGKLQRTEGSAPLHPAFKRMLASVVQKHNGLSRYTCDVGERYIDESEGGKGGQHAVANDEQCLHAGKRVNDVRCTAYRGELWNACRINLLVSCRQSWFAAANSA